MKKFGMNDCKMTSTPLMHNEKICKDDGANKVNEQYCVDNHVLIRRMELLLMLIIKQPLQSPTILCFTGRLNISRSNTIW